MARELAARGFAPALGIHHRGPYNAFNLADDMMEAWRPFADLLVARHMEAGPAGDDAERAPADKAALLGLLHRPVGWEGGPCLVPPARGRQGEAGGGRLAGKGARPPLPPGGG